MQEDFHYYATYCAAYLAGYSHEESLAVCYSAQFVDLCSRSFLAGLKAPLSAATTQLSMEMMNTRLDVFGLQEITRIWASFHFLPRDLYADVRGSRAYRNKYRLICGPNGELLKDTVELAGGGSLQAAGVAMHVLADTWAHQYFAGTPSLVINNTDYHLCELIPDGSGCIERPVTFRHSLSAPDDPETGTYTGSLYQATELSVMNLGHGRAGHLPDYSYIRYRYLPAWGNFREVIKDNPAEYLLAFRQMIYAMQYLRGQHDTFETERYDTEACAPLEEEIRKILAVRRTDASADWKSLGERLSGREIPAFSVQTYRDEYLAADGPEKDDTFLGRFILAAMAQKSMVTNRIFRSGNMLAGYSIEYNGKRLGGIRDFKKLLESRERSDRNE